MNRFWVKNERIIVHFYICPFADRKILMGDQTSRENIIWNTVRHQRTWEREGITHANGRIQT